MMACVVSIRNARLKTMASLLRLSHWSKSGFVLLGFIYAGKPTYWLQALLAALAFCFISSVVYIYNDIKDIEEDRRHPRKRLRPLVSGVVSMTCAKGLLCALLLVGFTLAWIVSNTLVVILCIYLLINVFYNYGLRTIVILDVLCIASGFMLRVFAGTVAIGLPITIWLTLAATMLSLFIALSKRRLELNMDNSTLHRAVLKNYSERSLDIFLFLSGMGCFITYLSYVLMIRNQSFLFLLTLPSAGLGLFRFWQLLLKTTHQDDPVHLFLHDPISRINSLFFIMVTVLALSI